MFRPRLISVKNIYIKSNFDRVQTEQPLNITLTLNMYTVHTGMCCFDPMDSKLCESVEFVREAQMNVIKKRV